jgi:uncharacterized protein (DUF3820 family)
MKPNAVPGRHATTYHNPPSSSQPLPTPLTTRALPPSDYLPPSSQPTPSKRPTEIRLSQIAPSTQPSPYAFPAPAPTPLAKHGQSGEHPLYQFPFGMHRGKTLLEVPENYIAYLRFDQGMANSMPGFAAVLRLFDAGQPPALPLPPPTMSQPSPSDAPPSSAPARIPASQPVSLQEPLSPMPASSQTEYRFDFGKHAGKTLAKVPSDYITFLKQRGIVEDKPALAVAVIKHERGQSRSAQVTTSSQPDLATFTLKFGKHKGKTLYQVPSDYLAWLKTSSNLYNESQPLRDAIAHYEGQTPQHVQNLRETCRKAQTCAGGSVG